VDIKKLALMATFAFVITGIVVYQVRATRGIGRSASPSGSSPAVPVIPTPETPQASFPRVSTTESRGEAPRTAVESQVLSIPAKGWGRSPFLTVDEIARLNQPAAPTPVIAPAAPPPPVVESLPQYNFRGVIISSKDAVAFLDGRAVRIGDRLGREVVKEIKDESVILEYNGKTRELSKKTNPKGDR
jgi:hypothetical protein